MSLMQRTLATLEEYTDFSVPTVMSIIMELKMSGTIFQDWMKDTSSMKQPPSAKHMLDFVERYRRGLAATGTPVQPANKSHISVKKPYKPPPVFHMRVSSGCKLCSGEDHVLHQCPDLRNMTVEQRQSTSQRLKACGNCLGADHTTRNCPSKRSCWTCGRRHHSLLHRTDAPQQSQPSPSTSAPAGHPRILYRQCMQHGYWVNGHDTGNMRHYYRTSGEAAEGQSID